MRKITSLTLLVTGLSVGAASSAHALNARTWISGKGVDQANCGPVASPCRTLQFAHDQTSAGGEINVLDPAGYGAVTIGKAINIVNEGVGVAGVLASTGNNAVTVNAPNGDTVILRGLTIEGAGVGANGVVFNSGAGLQVSNCFIRVLSAATRTTATASSSGTRSAFPTSPSSTRRSPTTAGRACCSGRPSAAQATC